ncbi:TRAP transporter small permease subunit [Algicola sagamiensis]|uniref:TRAP transporter small permease subunit n=1 Tax=Algicola sagamiensis TaxID=163869 RepID=UPI000376D6D2|nr:TRAP transporter small permease subunit [Algicola sagamiensis]
MKLLVVLERHLQALIRVLGQSIAWLTFIMVILTCLIVLLRYGFNLGWIWLQELVLYMHAAVFMLGVSYAFQKDQHVRVDIFYRSFSAKTKHLVNLFGHIFLLFPVSILILWFSWDYVAMSWHIKESSPETGGLPFVYLLKSLVPMMSLLLMIQGVASFSGCILALYRIKHETNDKEDKAWNG